MSRPNTLFIVIGSLREQMFQELKSIRSDDLKLIEDVDGEIRRAELEHHGYT